MPCVAFVGSFDGASFLHEETISGARLRELLKEGLLRALVGGGHEVARTFDGDLQILHLPEIAFQPSAGFHNSGGHDHQGGADH